MLVADTVRSRRAATVAWVVGGGVFMVGVAAAYAAELEEFPGGAAAAGAALEAAAQAMRLLRWPAERLDTFGGYITYHNLTLLALVVSLWAGVQGVRTLRGANAELSMEQILATGRTRRGVLGHRVIGFIISLALVTLAMGLAVAVAGAIAGEFDLWGSLLAVLSPGLCALAAYGLGLLVGQIAPTARAGSGAVSIVVTALYLLTNVWEELGLVGGLRFVSPFHYANQSRVLVPDHTMSVPAVLTLAGLAAIAMALASWVFDRRDVHSSLWTPRPRKIGFGGTVTARSYVVGELGRRKTGLVAWAASMALVTALLAWMAPEAIDLWANLGVTWTIVTRGAGFSPTDQYLAFSAELVVPVIAGFVIAQAAGWVSEMRDGRVEMMLAHPMTWRGFIARRLAVSTIGVLTVAIAGGAGLLAGGAAVGIDVEVEGLVRTMLATVLVGLALGGLAAALVAWLRSGLAVIVASMVVAASYLLLFLAPAFEWPDWVTNISLFGAFGRPYLEIPDTLGLVFLVGLAVVGYTMAVATANRLPKVA